MVIDRDKDAKAGKETTPSQNQSTTPSGPPESPWIMHSLNQILEQIDKAEKRIQEQLNGLEARLRRFERLFWICQGGADCRPHHLGGRSVPDLELPDFIHVETMTRTFVMAA